MACPAAPVMKCVFTKPGHVLPGADKGSIFFQPNVGGQFVFPEHLDHVLSGGRAAGGPCRNLVSVPLALSDGCLRGWILAGLGYGQDHRRFLCYLCLGGVIMRT